MTAATDVLAPILAEHPPPYALLHRPEAGTDGIEVLIGELSTPTRLADVPIATRPAHAGHQVLLVVPYRQMVERGFSCVDDRAALLAMRVTRQATLPMSEVFARVPADPLTLANQRFDPDDATYARTVRAVVTDEIGTGRGSNFVMRRSFLAEVVDYRPRRLLGAFRRLCERESGAYWTFLVHLDGRAFVGATPERHVSLNAGAAMMNPISGTYRYPAGGPTLAGLLEFLTDDKEVDELYMVVDEELKMMSRICPTGGRLTGPHVLGMGRVAHTGYLIEGRTREDPRDIIRETMFAPTVTGSPLESACRVIRDHEPHGRGYYSGVIALIGADDRGETVLDSSILIRTAELDRSGRLRIGVGASIVRHSDPAAEAAETRAKAAGLLDALAGPPSAGRTAPAGCARRPLWTSLGRDPAVRAELRRRNEGLARFWFREAPPGTEPPSALTDVDILVVDAEDAFSAMISDQVRALGGRVTVRRFDSDYTCTDHDLVILGPGPGDPCDTADPRIAHLRATIEDLLTVGQPFLAVCLSHQVLSRHLGLELVRSVVPTQGMRRTIDLFGVRERVAFYNTFFARSTDDRIPWRGTWLDVSRDRVTGEVYALRGPRFSTMQFHPESVLTENGPRIFATRIREMLGDDDGDRGVVGSVAFSPDR